MKEEFKAQRDKALENRAYSCKSTEFEAMLVKYMDDEDAVIAIVKGFEQQKRTEDRGSYCESASYGYGDMLRKEKILEQFYVGEGSFSTRKIAIQENKDDVLALLQKQVAEMAEVLRKLSSPKGPRLNP